MNTPTLLELEQQIQRLTTAEKRWLAAWLTGHLGRESAEGAASTNPLAAMAADPEVQREIRAIEEVFEGTLADGLEGV